MRAGAKIVPRAIKAQKHNTGLLGILETVGFANSQQIQARGLQSTMFNTRVVNIDLGLDLGSSRDPNSRDNSRRDVWDGVYQALMQCVKPG